MLVFLAAAIAGALAPTPATGAAQAWIRATTPNFELYTTESPAKAREAVLHFEKVRAFFIRSSKELELPPYTVRIVAFRSEQEYRPYSPNQNASAYYHGGVHHDTVVMQGLGGAFDAVAVHEYVHLVLRNSNAELPLWLQEGMAEYYSTLRPSGKETVTVGEFPVGRGRFPAGYAWMDAEALFRADRAWLARAGGEQVRVFYAQSWATTHMLALSGHYRHKYPQFLREITGGTSTAEALRKVYGKTAGQFHAELKNYFRVSLFRANVFPFSLETETDPPDIRPATALEWRIALADLDAARPDKKDQARQAYATLAVENPESWEPRMGMAYLELLARNRAAASQQFAAAEKLGCRDPRAFLHWGMYAPAEGGPRERARVFLKAVEFKPGDPVIAYNAGLGLAAAGDCEAALPHLLKVPSITPDQAPAYLRAVAVCAHNTGEDARAQAAAKQLRSRARTPQEEQAADALVRMAGEPIHRPSPNSR